MTVDNEVRPQAGSAHAPEVARTVLGDIPTAQLGVIAVSESLLSIVPGAEYAYDIVIDRAEIFDALATQLRAFAAAGGSTIVDTTGMFHGRDVRMLEDLARATGVHIIASTGMGPEENLGGYFLTPQTNPPTPWPEERFAALFAAEQTEGMVVQRRERRGPAGIIVTAGTRSGATPTDESLARGAALAANATGGAVIHRFGADPVAELDMMLSTGIRPDRVVVAGLDRRDGAAHALDVARRGSLVLLDRVGFESPEHLSDAERADLVAQLIAEGHGHQLLISTGAIGVAKGLPADARAFASVLTDFVPLLLERGVTETDARTLLTANPAALLAVKGA